MTYNYTLENGIRVIVNKMSGMYSASIGILVGAGSVNETPEENGISHFIEHVNFKGTNKRTAFDISNDSDMLGAQINAYTSKEYTCYYIKSISENMAASFEILADLFVDSIYDEKELDRERGVIIEEINMYDDTPDDLCVENLSAAYFGNNGFGATILGSKENVSRFTRADVLKYKSKYYTPDNIVVAFAGGVDEKEVFELCEKYLGGIKKTKMAEKPAYNTVNLCKSVARSKDIEQVHIALGFRGESITSDDADISAIVSFVLGGGMSSRLFQSVREKLGLCYNVYSYFSNYLTCGQNVVYAGVNKDNVSSALDAILAEMRLLKDKGINEEEFMRSREQMKSGIVYSQESSVSQMLLYGKRMLLIGDTFDFAERLKEINSLTKDGVNSVIARLIDTDNLAKSIVGADVKPL